MIDDTKWITLCKINDIKNEFLDLMQNKQGAVLTLIFVLAVISSIKGSNVVMYLWIIYILYDLRKYIISGIWKHYKKQKYVEKIKKEESILIKKEIEI